MSWFKTHKEQSTTADHIADLISSFAGSWLSFWIHVVWFYAWFGFSLDINLLTLIVSLEAIFLCIFLLMSGNRQSERDRHQADADYQTNLQAKYEIEELMETLARIEEKKLESLITALLGLTSAYAADRTILLAAAHDHVAGTMKKHGRRPAKKAH